MQRRGRPHPRLRALRGRCRPAGDRHQAGRAHRRHRPAGRRTWLPAADLRADGAIGGLRAVVSTGVDVRRTRPRTGNGRPLAEAPGGQITAVPGKLPDGWRWVTELDPEPRRASPRKQRNAAPALPAAEAPAQRRPATARR